MSRRATVSTQQITTIVMMVVLLVAVLVLRRSCARGTASLFNAIDVPADAGARRDAPR